MNFIVMGLGFVVNFSLGLGREIEVLGGFGCGDGLFLSGFFRSCGVMPRAVVNSDLKFRRERTFPSFLPSSRGSGRSATWCCGRLCARPRTPLRCNSALRSNLPAFPASARCCSAVPRSPAAPEFAKGAISFLPCRCGLGGDHCPARADSSSCL